MKENKISIIIPIYNVEKYLKECLDSVINQTYKNLEILCIDDGSPDNSIEILEQYMRKDQRIKIIRQENKGLAETRNIGIKKVTGKFIFFLDSDDWLPLNALELMLETQQKMESDIVIGGVINIIKNKEYSFIPQLENKNYFFYDYIINALKTNQFKAIACGKLYKTEIIKKYNLNFPKGYLYEDLIFTLMYLYYSKKIFNLPKNVYYYRYDRDNSIINCLNKRDMDSLKSVKKIEEFFKEKKEYELLENIFFQKYIFEWIIYATIGKFCKKEIKYKIFKEYILEIKKDIIFQKYKKLYLKIPLKQVSIYKNKIYLMLLDLNINLSFIYVNVYRTFFSKIKK